MKRMFSCLFIAAAGIFSLSCRLPAKELRTIKLNPPDETRGLSFMVTLALKASGGQTAIPTAPLSNSDHEKRSEQVMSVKSQYSRLKRPRYTMPASVSEALHQRHLLEAYQSRPAYQQNDYIGWITRAKREETRQKRLAQMLEELEGGERYMNMPYHPKK